MKIPKGKMRPLGSEVITAQPAEKSAFPPINSDKPPLDFDALTSCAFSHGHHFDDDQIFLINISDITWPRVLQRWTYDEKDVMDLAKDISKFGNGNPLNGLLQPIIVRVDNNKLGKYPIVEGKTRILAMEFLGQTKIKAIVRDNLTEKDGYFAGYRANEVRSPTTSYDKGMSFAALIESGIVSSQEEIVNETGLSKQTVSALVSFSKLPLSTRSIIELNKSKFGYNHAQLLNSLTKVTDELTLNKAVEKIGSGQWSLQKLTSFTKSIESPKSRTKNAGLIKKQLFNYGNMKYSNDALEVSLTGLKQETIEKIAREIEEIISSSNHENNFG